jgi:predicted MFS family arabinose efflux permease
VLKTNPPKLPLYIVSLMCCSYAVAFVDRALVSVASAPIKHDLDLTDSQIGFLNGTAFATLYCLCGVPLGWLADRIDRRALIAAGLLFWTAMTAGCGLAGSFVPFLVARIGVGLGEACLVPAGMSLLGSSTPREKMARSVAIFLMGATIGNIIALLAGGYILARLGEAGPITLPVIGMIAPWQALFFLACPPGLVVAALVMTIREPARNLRASAPWCELRAAAAHLRANRRAYGFLTAATACNIALAQAQAAWMPLFYVRHFGLPPASSAMTVGVIFLISAPVGQWAGGLFIDRLQAWGVAAPPNVVLALCTVLCIPPAVIFCTTDQIRLSELAYVFFNFLVSAATPAGLTGWQLLTPEWYRGRMIGLGPAIVGVLTDHVFHEEQALGQAMMTVFVGFAAAGCLLALAGRRPFARSQLDLAGLPMSGLNEG